VVKYFNERVLDYRKNDRLTDMRLCLIRLDETERKALKHALKDFHGEIYLFGSRTDNSKRGGDIDILLIPQKKSRPLKMSLEIQKRFFSLCEEHIDVVIYNNSPFCQEILKNAKKLDLTTI